MQTPQSQTKETANGIAALAEFARAASFADLSQLARTRVAEHLMDTVGVALAGCAEPGGRIIVDVVADARASGTARIIGAGIAVPTWDAAWVNGTLANMLDFDDTGFTHPGVCLVPAALAVCEAANSTGKQLVTSLAVGYEICARMSAIIGGVHNSKMRARGIHPMAVVGGIAAAAAAGNALGLNQKQMRVAFGLAATAGFGFTQQFGTWAKGVHAGNAARSGVMGALLAQRDYYASETAVEGRFGQLNALLGEGNFDLERGLPGLGDGWAIAEPGADMKLHPACGGLRGVVQAAIKLRKTSLSSHEQIEKVTISVPERLLDTLFVDRPERGYGGKFSTRYSVAVALVDGDLTIDSFNDETLARKDIQDMMSRIQVLPKSGAGLDRKERHYTPIRVYCRDGRVFNEDPPAHPKGMRNNRMSREEIVNKYLFCARRMLKSEQATRSVEVLEKVESLAVRELISAVVADKIS